MDNNLHGTISDALGNLTSLVELDLSYNLLEGTIPTSLANLCNLREIGLSYLKLNQQVNELLEILAPCISHGLTTLAVRSSQLSGNLTDQIGAFKNIDMLDFSNNLIGGALPRSFVKLSSLRYLYLSINKFSGNPFESIGSLLSKLSSLRIDGNNFQGVVKEDDLANLKSLKEFHASGNNFTLKVGSNWLPSFQLTYLDVGSWQLGPSFPSWIQSQKKLKYLGMSNTGIIDSIPTQMWEAQSQKLKKAETLIWVDFVECPKVEVVYGSTSPQHWYGVVRGLDEEAYRRWSFGGEISPCLADLKHLNYLDLSGNYFLEKIPPQIGNLSKLRYLDLSDNDFEGMAIPSFLGTMTSLTHLDLSDTGFMGKIPSQIGNLSNLTAHSLTIMNHPCSTSHLCNTCISHGLTTLAVQSSRLSGNPTDHIGAFKNIVQLDFSNNLIGGSLPRSFGKLSSLRYLDLSMNKFSGNPFESLRSLSKLLSLHIDGNLFHGVVKEDDLANLTSLTEFVASGNNFTLKVGPNWIPNFQLTYLEVTSWQLGPSFPLWIQSQNKLQYVGLSNTGIFDSIPTQMWEALSQDEPMQLEFLNLASNNLSGEIPDCWMNWTFLWM
ncbi:probable inactive leucine-rich repeat receptor kinase XIAO [Glycine max]|uniref:probable inactive leucine-rich repeat receptor kinase XIAO n=1 Tax=Glycine max TaxID=3847 RepID=UPI001B35777F|nr:probable inactive leucine-rich repeat receptor kinase XIAO [Glycine max]